jgi:hypothetical protein
VLQDEIDPVRKRAAQQDRKVQSEARVQQDVEDIKWLMSERIGRRIMFGLLEQGRVFQGSFTGDNETFFLEGKRAVGLTYLAVVNAHCPDQFVLMLREHAEDGRRS